MKSRQYHPVFLWLASLLLLVSACGEPSPEKMLERSRKISELYQFGTLYVPLYQQAVVDSNWTPIRNNIREIVRMKQNVNRLEVPENISLQKREWESNRRLFSRAVDNLNVVMSWPQERAEAGKLEVAEGVQLVFDWWGMLVKMVR